MVAGLVNQLAFPHVTTWASSPALLPQCSRQQGAVPVPLLSPYQTGSPTHTTRASSTILPKRGAGPTFPVAAVCEGQGQLFHSHVPEVGCRWQELGMGRAGFPHPCHHMTYPRGGRGPFLAFISTGWISWAPPANRVCSSVHPRQGVGASLPSAPVAEGQGQFFLLLQPMRSGANSVYPYLLRCKW